MSPFLRRWNRAPLRATFCVDSKPYSFVSSLADSSEQAVGVILLKRPDSLMHYERRGAPRRRLQPGVPVQIFATQHSTNQPGTEPIDARLLNLSESGMACLIEVAATPHLRDGASVLLEFELPGAEKSFSLSAVIITTTHGVGHHRVIGLEFVPDKALREQSVPLRQCLQVIFTERRQNEPSGVQKESIAP
jgi:c-di-GMP-binding flagellar brake protein YcgR